MDHVQQCTKKKESWSKQGEASIAKPELTPRKVMLCVVRLEKNRSLRAAGRTIGSNLYCQQLKRLRQVIERKRPELINRKGVVFYHDNARLYTSLAT